MAEKKYSNFGIRLVASIVDGIVLSAVTGLARQLFGFGLPFGRRVWGNVNFLVGALYSILLWVNWHGQTVGKKLMKIKVVREDGKPLDYRDAILRYLGYFVSAFVFLFGFFWVIWDEKKQGWHDKIAKTFVVEE
jgi:uncharacterized RDD family membrane protein YckC